jgi:guanylate kinase
VIAGPSGAGKSTLIKHVMECIAGKFEFSVSSTTRAARTGEVDGVNYHFQNRAEFEKKINSD